MDRSIKTQLTRDDLIRSGACPEGVYEWCEEHGVTATAMPTRAVLKLAKRTGDSERIIRAAGLDGYGDGDGDGDGDGYGYGYGYGDGDGDGNGYGDGYGDGDGDGNGNGYGDGYGDGDGDGNGNGYGDGNGEQVEEVNF